MFADCSSSRGIVRCAVVGPAYGNCLRQKKEEKLEKEQPDLVLSFATELLKLHHGCYSFYDVVFFSLGALGLGPPTKMSGTDV